MLSPDNITYWNHRFPLSENCLIRKLKNSQLTHQIPSLLALQWAYVYILLIKMMARLQAVLLLVMAGCVLPAGKPTNFPKPTCPDRAKSQSECELWSWTNSDDVDALKCVWRSVGGNTADPQCVCNYNPPFCQQKYPPVNKTTYTTTKVQVPAIYTTSSSSRTLSADTNKVGGVVTSTTATTRATRSTLPASTTTLPPSVTTSAPPPKNGYWAAIFITCSTVGLLVGVFLGTLVQAWRQKKPLGCCALTNCWTAAGGARARAGRARHRMVFMQRRGPGYEALPLNDANDSASAEETGDEEELDLRVLV